MGGAGSWYGAVVGYGEGAAVCRLSFWLRSAGSAGGVVPHQSGEPNRPVAGLPGPAASGRPACPGGGIHRGAALLQPARHLRGRTGPPVPNPGADVARHTARMQYVIYTGSGSGRQVQPDCLIAMFYLQVSFSLVLNTTSSLTSHRFLKVLINIDTQLINAFLSLQALTRPT